MNELTKYLDPKVLGRIQRLDLMVRLVVEGFLSGMHRSPFHGPAVEFAQHRQYTAGDDIKHIDWKVHAKTDRYYIKQYEQETNLKATFLVDVSESMTYASSTVPDGMSKYHYAACVAASLGLLLLKQQDAVGLATFDQDVRSVVPPAASPNHIKAIVHALDAAEPANKTSLEPICHSLAEKLPQRGMVCLVSDLLVDTDGLIRGLQHFRHRKHEVMVMHVLDRDELTFPFQGNTMFNGLEGAGRLAVEPRSLREGYLRAMEEFCGDVQRRCVANQIDYKRISTADNLGSALSSFLAAKAAAARKASCKR
jgi:uncharacterized protein (DUF58 family)